MQICPIFSTFSPWTSFENVWLFSQKIYLRFWLLPSSQDPKLTFFTGVGRAPTLVCHCIPAQIQYYLLNLGPKHTTPTDTVSTDTHTRNSRVFSWKFDRCASYSVSWTNCKIPALFVAYRSIRYVYFPHNLPSYRSIRRAFNTNQSARRNKVTWTATVKHQNPLHKIAPFHKNLGIT